MADSEKSVPLFVASIFEARHLRGNGAEIPKFSSINCTSRQGFAPKGQCQVKGESPDFG
jgi:hypothetical protein